MGPDLILPPRTREILVDSEDEAITYWHEAYGGLGRTAQLPAGAVIRHHAVDVGQLLLCDVEIPPDFTYVLDPLDVFVVASIRVGRIEFAAGREPRRATAGDVVLTGELGDRRWGQSHGVAMYLTLVHPALLDQVIGTLPPAKGAPVRFSRWTPVSRAAAAQWNVSRLFVSGLLRAPATVATPLVVGQASRMLAATLLATFPHDGGRVDVSRSRGSVPHASLERAIAFIESHPERDIGIVEIAEAARVSARAVQQAFRRHLGTTPTEYLRVVRLHHVRDELEAADPSTETVEAVARRWGFLHRGRFGAVYRGTFGESPSETLRRGAHGRGPLGV